MQRGAVKTLKKRYLPFGYEIRNGELVVDLQQAEIVRCIFQTYIAGETLQQIADWLTAQKIAYRENVYSWNKNAVSRILANEKYCGTAHYPPLITKVCYEEAMQIRNGRTSAYSATLAPFRKDLQCGCCGEKLYWHGKSNQWICRNCKMWSAPISDRELATAIEEKLRWILKNPARIRPPKSAPQAIPLEAAQLDRTIQRELVEETFEEAVLIEQILHRAEVQYDFCTAGNADPATLHIRKMCTETKLPEDFPIEFYKKIVSNVVLHRNADIDIRLKNGQIL